jgi:Protein of unknown function (DUF3307)
MTWPALFGVFLLSHLVGDFLLQTSWQATHKAHGFGGDTEARRALVSHGLVYTLAFVPALIWVASESGIGIGLGVAALVLLPHVIIDEGTLVASWVRHIKHVEGAPSVVVRHVVMLAGVALLATS